MNTLKVRILTWLYTMTLNLCLVAHVLPFVFIQFCSYGATLIFLQLYLLKTHQEMRDPNVT